MESKSENPSGVQDVTSVPSGNEKLDGYVKLETYKKSVSQEKALRGRLEEAEARLNEYIEKEKTLQEEQLTSQQKFQELAQLREQELAKEREEKEVYRKSLLDAHKLNAVKEKLPGKVKRPEYYNFINTDDIKLDDNGHVIEDTLESVVNSFLEQHSSLLDVSKGKNPPSQAPGSPQPHLSVEEWQKLPLAEKKKRMGEVFKNYTE